MNKKLGLFFREWSFNILLGCIGFHQSYQHMLHYAHTGATPTLLLILQQFIIGIFFLTRCLPHEVSFKKSHWFAAGVSTFLPITITSNHYEFQGDEIFLVIQFIGVSISVIGVLSLNRSLGVVPANRGIRSAGAYKYIRHPIYLGYILHHFAFISQNLADWKTIVWNISIIGLSVVAITFRIKYEEGFLSKTAEYRHYIKTTPYRLFPKIW